VLISNVYVIFIKARIGRPKNGVLGFGTGRNEAGARGGRAHSSRVLSKAPFRGALRGQYLLMAFPARPHCPAVPGGSSQCKSRAPGRALPSPVPLLEKRVTLLREAKTKIS